MGKWRTLKMTEKRFTPILYETGELYLKDNETNCLYKVEDSFVNVEVLCERLNEQHEEIEKLNSEINMLKTTISRNEAYIERLTRKGEWK